MWQKWTFRSPFHCHWIAGCAEQSKELLLMMPIFHPWQCWIWMFCYTELPGVEVSLPSLLSSHQSHPLAATKTLVLGLIFDLLFSHSVFRSSQIPGRSTTFPSHVTHSHLADIPSSGGIERSFFLVEFFFFPALPCLVSLTSAIYGEARTRMGLQPYCQGSGSP